jgi:hypothetical protein
MPSPVPSTEQSTAEADRLWRLIAGHLREACILRRQGRHHAAATILEHELPPLIRQWSTECALPSAEAKSRLNQLFSDEQSRVESHWIIARFLAANNVPDADIGRLVAFPTTPAAPSSGIQSFFSGPASQATSAAMFFPSIAPRRIPIGDVVDMIDASQEIVRTAAFQP